MSIHLENLENFAGLESKPFDRKIRHLEPVTNSEFKLGKGFKNSNPYEGRDDDRRNLSEFCLIEPFLRDTPLEAVVGETVNHSEGGICVKCEGNSIRKGSTHLISVKALNDIRREGESIWIMPINSKTSIFGFKWLG
ncbi:MAG: hypothetical protein IME96_09550 [Proteobacteria bacterium]|nr:hypothetical protein [Pseudomonadota bacterium]